MLRFIFGVLFLLLNIIVINFWGCENISQKSYSSLKPETKYVGMAVCSGCHSDIYKDYIQTGMGRSFYLPDSGLIIENFNQRVHDEFKNLNYIAFWNNNNFYILEYRLSGKDTVHSRLEKIDYIVGSGNQTRSYLHNRNGFIYEAPITWYVEKQKWDLSPGYHNGNNTRFDRPIGTECMNCHNGFSEHIKGTVNRYKEVALGIDCERCHGPGSDHVERMNNSEMVNVEKEIDYSIVNSSKLPIDLQFDVCQQCHLQGTNVFYNNNDFRPGAKLSLNYDIFLIKTTESANAFGIASHAERLRQSACFQKAQLNCTSCHNPHKSVHKTDPAFYRKACLNCHKEQSCNAPITDRKKENDACQTCHLPRGGTRDIPHVSFTDHFIRVVKQQPEIKEQKEFLELVCATNSNPDLDTQGKAYLNFFEQQATNRKDLAQRALNLLNEKSYFEKSKAYFALEKWSQSEYEARLAVAEDSSNTWRLFHLAMTLEKTDKKNEALYYYEKCFKINENLVEAAVNAANLHLQLATGKQDALEKSKKWLEKALKIQPYNLSALTNIGFIYLNSNEFVKAENYLLRALKLNPDHAQAMENLIYVYGLKKERQTALFYFNKWKIISRNANKEVQIQLFLDRNK